MKPTYLEICNKLKKAFLIIFVFGQSLSMAASLDGTMIKNTGLKEKPQSQSKDVGQISKNAAISILTREGGWYQVKAITNLSGWVKMLSVRFDRKPYRPGKLGIGSVLSVMTTGHSDVTATTGVRGLSEEDLRNARPDFSALAKLVAFQANTTVATNFARKGRLKTNKIAYLEKSHD